MNNLSEEVKKNSKITVGIIIGSIIVILILIFVLIFGMVHIRKGHEYILCESDGQQCNNVEGKYIVYTDNIKGIGVIKKSMDPTRKCDDKYFGLDPAPGVVKKCYKEKNILR